MKITKQIVDNLKPGAFAWSSGFGVKATATGTKVYVVSYRIGKRKRRYTIGPHGVWTVEAARKEAHRLLRLVGTGVDPMAHKAAAREAPTVRELAERFMTEHVGAKRKVSTWRTYRGCLDHVLPAFGGRSVADVTREDIATLHHRLRRTPAQANRVVMMLSKMFNLAEAWGLRSDGSNPCRHIEKYGQPPRRRYLSAEEFRRLGEALAAAARGAVPVFISPIALAAIRLLLFTGARRAEILSLKWDNVDLERAELRLPTSKTGPKVVHLNAPAIDVLTSLPHVVGNAFCFPGLREGQHLVNVSRTWDAVRSLAGLKDVRLHDLRHSHASVGVGAGISLAIIGGLLGHAQAQTTQRYAHLAADPLKAAAELVGARIVEAMKTA